MVYYTDNVIAERKYIISLEISLTACIKLLKASLEVSRALVAGRNIRRYYQYESLSG